MNKDVEKCIVWVFMCIVLFSAKSWSDESIRVGLSAPLTGHLADSGSSFKNAAELAIEQINQKGGIWGKRLELVIGDSQGEPDISKRVARKFTEDNRIVASIGDLSSSCSMAARPIYQRGKMVQLSPTSSHPAFASGSPYSFEIIGTNDIEAKFNAQMAVNHFNKKKLGVIFVNNDYGVSGQKFFSEEAKRLGAEVVVSESYLEQETNFAEHVRKVYAAKPEMLYLCSLYNDGAAILKQIKSIGWKELIVTGPKSLTSAKLIESGGDAVENLIISTIFSPKSKRNETAEFIKIYQEKYGQIPNMYAALAYDAMNILAKAISESKPDRQAIRDKLAEIKNYMGVTGKISFTPDRDVDREYILLQVKNGDFIIYSANN